MTYFTYWLIHMAIALAINMIKHGEDKNVRYNFWWQVGAVALSYWIGSHFGLFNNELYWRW